MIKLGIVIPVFNGLEFTKKSLASICEASRLVPGITFEIILIDDGSTDGTSKWVKEHHKEVHVLQGDGGLWWSGGINKGTEYALNELSCNYILWWNNDIVQREDYFQQLEGIIKAYDVNTVLGSKIYDANKPELLWAMGGYFDPASGKKDMYGRGEKDGETYNEPLDVDWFPGMGTLFHKSVFEKIGYCDAKTFPQYYGDSDFTYRAKLAGYRLIAHPKLKLYNDTSHTAKRHDDSFARLLKSLTDIKSIYNIRKDLTFYRKYARSNRAYFYLFRKHAAYIGGFFKWKFLGMFGVKKK